MADTIRTDDADVRYSYDRKLPDWTWDGKTIPAPRVMEAGR
jgi:hypothetical protein